MLNLRALIVPGSDEFGRRQKRKIRKPGFKKVAFFIAPER